MPTSTSRASLWRALTLLVALAAPIAWAWISPLEANDVVGGDEGYYGTMARNVLADPGQWLAPSLTPLGPPGDKPPLYPALLAASVRAFGATATALRWPTLALAALLIALTGALVRRLSGSAAAGLGGALLLASLPWFADASRVCAAEPMVAAFGMAALVVCAREPLSPWRAFAGGVLIGLAFLAKLWLASLFALALLARFATPRAWRLGAVAAAGFALAGDVQLAAAALAGPAMLVHVARVTFGFSLASRAGGEGFASYWLLPAHYYVVMLAKAFVLSSPLVLVGLAWTLRRVREPGPRMLAGAMAGLLLISAFRVKAGGYAYPLVPVFAAVAALGAHALAGRARALAVALVAVAVVGGAVRQVQRLPQRYHAPGYGAVARALEPALASAPPGARVLLAPEAPAFGYLTFRTAGYWGTPYSAWSPARRESLAADRTLRAFVVDTRRERYGGWPDEATLAWLEANTREITGDVPGLDGLRVFVRR